MNFGPTTCGTTCPQCQTPVSTKVEKESTTNTHLIALLLCIFCCPAVCCPYLCDCFKTTNHYCPQCNALLGTYRE